MSLSTALLAADQLDGITITAPTDPQTERTGDVVAEESAVTRQRIPAQRLAEGNASLARVLGRSAGTQTRGAGGFGSVETISIRAGTSAQTGVYLDGVRLNRAGNPAFDFATLDALGLASVDLYRGGTPLALGGGDIGGAVNLRTQDVQGTEPAASLGVNVGSFGAQGVRIGASAGRGAWQALGAIGARQADNDFEVLDNNGTRFNPLDDQRERRLNTDAERSSLLGRLQYTFDDRREASVLLQASTRDTGIPTPRNNPDNDARFSDDSLSLQLAHTIDRIGLWNTRQTLFVNGLDNEFDDEDGDVGLGAQLTDATGRTLGARAFAERIGERGTLAIVAEASEETLDRRDNMRAGRDLEARRVETSVLSHYAFWLYDDAIVVTPGIEWRRTRDRVQIDEAAIALRGAPPATNETTFTQRLGVRASLGRGFSVRANAARLQRSPSFAELFGDSGLMLASPDLVSEEGVNLELALGWQDHPESSRHSASFIVFSSERDNLISTVFDARGVGRAENIGEARALGVEVEASTALSKQWSIDGNLTWQDARQRSATPAFDNQRLPGQAEFAIGARLEWRSGRWRAWYGANHQRGRFFDTTNILPATDTTVQHAGIEWIRDGVSVSLSLDNIGDADVEDFRGFPRPGRSAFLSVQLMH